MAWLAVTWPDGRSESIELTHRKPVTVGSHANSNVVVEDDDIPALACRISWNGQDYEAVAAADDDIVLNGKKIRRRALTHRDELQIGSVKMTLHRGHAPNSRKKPGSSDGNDKTAPNEVLNTNDERDSVAPPPRAAASDSDEFEAYDDYEEEAVDENVRSTDDRSPQSKIRQRLHARARRPGQQDVTRSPLIYAMAGGVVVLVVTTLALTIFLRGQSISQQFQSAVAAHEAGRYADAERDLERFIRRHPTHNLTPKARRQLAINHVDRAIRGELPDWPEGLDRLNAAIGDFRDDADFETVHGAIVERAALIALGAASDAGKKREASLIDVSEQAEAVLQKYSPDAIVPETTLRSLTNTREASRNRLVQLNVLDEFLSRMDAAAKAGSPLKVLEAAGALAAADAALTREKPVIELTTEAINQLKAAVKTTPGEELHSESVDQTSLPDWRVSTIAIVDRPAGEEATRNEPLFVWHDDTWFACDRASGDPLWTRQLPGSFRPVPIEIPTQGHVAHDDRTNSLVIIDDENGTSVRTVALGKELTVSGRPTVIGAVAFLPCRNKLIRVDLDAGQVTSAIDIGQPVLPEPQPLARPTGSSLLVLGRSQLAYVVDPGSLTMQDQFWLEHAAGSILAPSATAAEFAVVCVNRPDALSADVVMLTTVGSGDDVPRLKIADRTRIDGIVTDDPVIRGRDLFVASTPERVTVLTLSDEASGKLTRGNAFVAGGNNTTPVPTYLLAAADREFWMASRRLTRLRATAEAIRIVGQPMPLSAPVQPPVAIGDDLYTVSRRRATSAATLARVDTQAYRERWQVQLGANAIGWIADASNSLHVVTDWGDIAKLDSNASSLVTRPIDELDGTARSLCKVGSKLAIASAKQISIVGATGRVERRADLAAPVTAPIITWGNNIAVPVTGRIQFFDLAARPIVADYWLPKGEQPAPAWRWITAVDATHLIAADAEKNLRVLTRVEGDKPHVAETVLKAFPELTLANAGLVDSESQAILPTTGGLTVADAKTLTFEQEIAAADLGGNRVLSLESVAAKIVVTVQTEAGVDLVTLGSRQRLQLPVKPLGLRPASDGRWIVTLPREVRLARPDDTALQSLPLPTTASGPAEQTGDLLVVPLIDGSVATLELPAP